jgi:orotate phosphoribosyltransferase
MIAQNIASLLLKEKAVFLRPKEPFTWTSGIKSPVYCDNRLLISSVEARTLIVAAMVEKISPMKPQIIAGTATAGIPWAAWVAHEMKLPLVYVRSSVKEHGRQNAIEGASKAGERVILLEDLVSTGKSSIAAAQRLKEADLEVLGVLSIFTYGFNDAQKIFDQAKLPFISLSNFDTLAQVAFDQNFLDAEALQKVLEWRKGVSLN